MVHDSYSWQAGQDARFPGNANSSWWQPTTIALLDRTSPLWPFAIVCLVWHCCGNERHFPVTQVLCIQHSFSTFVHCCHWSLATTLNPLHRVDFLMLKSSSFSVSRIWRLMLWVACRIVTHEPHVNRLLLVKMWYLWSSNDLICVPEVCPKYAPQIEVHLFRAKSDHYLQNWTQARHVKAPY